MRKHLDKDLQAAREALKQRDFRQAVAGFERHVARNGGDVESELELALAHLLDGNLEGFLELHEKIAPLMERAEPSRGRLARLWNTHKSLIAKAAGTAAALSLATAPLMTSACSLVGDESPDSPEVTTPAEGDSGARPQLEVPTMPPPPDPGQPAASVGATTEVESMGASSANPPPGTPVAPVVGGLPTTPPGSILTPQTASNPDHSATPGPVEQPVPPSTENPPPEVEPTPEPRPAPRPGPAHRYSGGVRPNTGPGGLFGGFATAGELVALEEAARVQRVRCDSLRREVQSTGSASARSNLRQCQANLRRMNRRIRALRARRR